VSKKRIQELEHALRFYASSLRYKGPNQPALPGALDPYTPKGFPYRMDVTRDGGAIARKALRKSK
jgi:hypothetical protein